MSFATKDVRVDDAVAYVLSKNLHRRHMTPSQLALVGAKAKDLYSKLAKERMSEGGKAAGRGRPQQGVVTLPRPIDSSKARDAAGKAETLIEKMEQEAKERQKRKPANSVVVTLPQQNTRTRDKLGKLANVSGSMVDRARKVHDKGVPELSKAVEQGRRP